MKLCVSQLPNIWCIKTYESDQVLYLNLKNKRKLLQMHKVLKEDDHQIYVK